MICWRRQSDHGLHSASNFRQQNAQRRSPSIISASATRDRYTWGASVVWFAPAWRTFTVSAVCLPDDETGRCMGVHSLTAGDGRRSAAASALLWTPIRWRRLSEHVIDWSTCIVMLWTDDDFRCRSICTTSAVAQLSGPVSSCIYVVWCWSQCSPASHWCRRGADWHHRRRSCRIRGYQGIYPRHRVLRDVEGISVCKLTLDPVSVLWRRHVTSLSWPTSSSL